MRIPECEEQLAEKSGELLALGGGQSRHGVFLGSRVGLDSPLGQSEALGGELDEHPAPVGRVRATTDEARPLEAIDTVCDRGRREQQRPRKLRRAHPVGLSGAA